MKKLNEKSWKKFSVFGNMGFLCISTTSSSIDGIRLIEDNDKIVPYITRSGSRNGLARFVSEKNCELGCDEANCITVGLDTQTAFYQPHKFVTGQNIHVVTGESINQYSALFYVTILRKQMIAKFNWGGNGATLGRMERLEAMLPVTSSNTPDYNYMSEYIQRKQDVLLNKYYEYLMNSIINIGESIDIPKVNEKNWEPFPIVNLFESFITGRGNGLNHLLKTQEGGINYIGATNRNNGVICYVVENDISKAKILPGNCIGFIKNGDGSAGYAIYKAESFISTNDVIYGYANWLNKYTGLFFVAAQDMIEDKYSHGHKRNKQHLKGDKVMLPISESGKPDFDYMEQYIKNMMLKKYKQYLAFLDKKRKKS